MSWLIVGVGLLVLAGEVVVIYTFHRWQLWEKLNLIPWLAAISKVVNPEKR